MINETSNIDPLAMRGELIPVENNERTMDMYPFYDLIMEISVASNPRVIILS
jgi:hypothetical protein